jgi:hypothetical protein
MDPILEALGGWSAYRWAEEAGVSPKITQRYLNGRTGRLHAEMRSKLEEAIRHHLAGIASAPVFPGLPE